MLDDLADAEFCFTRFHMHGRCSEEQAPQAKFELTATDFVIRRELQCQPNAYRVARAAILCKIN